MTEKSVNILICCTGSVATIQLPLLIKSLLDFNKTSECKVQMRVVMTKCACHFVDISKLNDNVKVYLDEEEWSTWTKRGDPVLHIDLGKWADILVIAPLDANTLAKLSTVSFEIVIFVSTSRYYSDVYILFKFCWITS